MKRFLPNPFNFASGLLLIWSGMCLESIVLGRPWVWRTIATLMGAIASGLLAGVYESRLESAAFMRGVEAFEAALKNVAREHGLDINGPKQRASDTEAV